MRNEDDEFTYTSLQSYRFENRIPHFSSSAINAAAENRIPHFSSSRPK